MRQYEYLNYSQCQEDQHRDQKYRVEQPRTSTAISSGGLDMQMIRHGQMTVVDNGAGL